MTTIHFGFEKVKKMPMSFSRQWWSRGIRPLTGTICWIRAIICGRELIPLAHDIGRLAVELLRSDVCALGGVADNTWNDYHPVRNDYD